MHVTISNNITIKHPSDEIKKWCEANLKISNPDYAKKVRMGFWVGSTPKHLYLYEVQGDKLILPFGTLYDIFPMLGDNAIVDDFKTPISIDYGQPVPLYPYQEEAVKQAYKAKFGILESKAGSGKTQMGIALIKKFGRRALWLTHTVDLLRQSKERAERYMDSNLIGTITEGKVNIGDGVTFATIQTMCKLDLAQYKNMWDVIVVDECFPENTLIQTPHGTVPIQHIIPGELVVTRNDLTGRLELCEVEELQIRELKGQLVKVTLTNGEEIVCTINHPFYTQDGYKKAGDLTSDDEVRMLRKGFQYFDLEQKSSIPLKIRKSTPVLFQRMWDKGACSEECVDGRKTRKITSVNAKTELRNCFGKNEEEQSYVESLNERKSGEHFENDRTQTKSSGWKWSRFDRATEGADGELVEIPSRNRVCDSHKNEKYGLSDTLQNRHCDTLRKGGNRGGWLFSHFSKSADRGYEKDGLLTRVRVGSVEVLEQGSDGTFNGLCKNGRVYNLSVKHNHNYFAKGVLVHNCHRVAGTPTSVTQFSKVLNSLAARHKYGLSATVHRADGMIVATYALLGKVVYAVPNEAVADKVMQVGIKPVSTGIQIHPCCLNTDGTLNYAKLINYLCERFTRNVIIRDSIVNESSKSCLILSDRLEHLEKLMIGLPKDMRDKAVMISGKMTTKKGKAEREQAIEDMRTGKKKYLFATYSLAREGLDIPCLERLFLTTPQKDFAVITQSIGRIARTCEGKSEPICYDFVDDIGYLVKSYKKRCSTYKKNDCYFVEEGENDRNS